MSFLNFTENSSEVTRRRKSLSQRRPLSAYGKLGHISHEGTPEKSVSINFKVIYMKKFKERVMNFVRNLFNRTIYFCLMWV